MVKLWQKGVQLNKQIEEFTVGSDHILDQKLVVYDCHGSKAHVEMLGQMGVITAEETRQISAELKRIIELSTAGKFPILPEDEDCHTAIENHLTLQLGDTGKKVHTFRSRNDQVLTALRLFYKEELKQLDMLIKELDGACNNCTERYGRIPIPGFSHTRKAMPFSVKSWLGAIRESMRDNRRLLKSVVTLIDQSPLGSGAGFGFGIKLDRRFTAQILGFARVQNNPMYVQNSRGKFSAAILNLLLLIMYDLNKLATDLILFSSPEFAFFKLPDEFLTGSSLMPQKNNPDVLEILRANYHRVLGWDTQVKSQIANLISGYHRDIQLSKEPVMKALEITNKSLNVTCLIIRNLIVDREACRRAMTEELFATDETLALVSAGIPFREAYRQIGRKLGNKGK